MSNNPISEIQNKEQELEKKIEQANQAARRQVENVKKKQELELEELAAKLKPDHQQVQ